MWFTDQQAKAIAARHATPVFVYSRQQLQERAGILTELQLPFGHIVRYAVKANSHPEIIRLFAAEGIHFDASSSYEATELLAQHVPGQQISLSSQQPAHNLPELLQAGVQYVATSLHQLRLFAAAAPMDGTVGLRVNPPTGSGHNNRTTTGGVNSSFGLWHEHVDDALTFVANKNIKITRLHVHIGSGADPAVWKQTIHTALHLVRRMPDVTTLDVGGGYKVSRFAGEQETDMQAIGVVFSEALQRFADETGRRIRLEIEPGTWLVAHAGVLLAEVVDIVDTGKQGHTFLRLNTGMNDIIRPAMYGAQHRIHVLNGSTKRHKYVVVGHNCETGDILTPAPGDPELIAPRDLKQAAIGDLVAIEDAGAYCASFATKNYNAFPSAAEIFV